MKIFVTGATGTVGKAVADRLSRGPYAVVAGVRSVERARVQLASLPGLAFRSFDFFRQETFQPALEGITHLFLMAPPAAQETGPILQMIEEARRAKVQHLTLHSGRTTGDLPASLLHQAEQAVIHSGLSYTILRSGWFMQNFLGETGREIREESRFYLPAGSSRTAFIDVRDIAAVVEQTFVHPRHRQQVYELVSAEALTHAEVAQLFSEVLERTVEYIDLDSSEYIARMKQLGWPEADAAFTVYLYDLVKTGKEAPLTQDVSDLLGRPPIPFRTFIRDYRHHWQAEISDR